MIICLMSSVHEIAGVFPGNSVVSFTTADKAAAE